MATDQAAVADLIRREGSGSRKFPATRHYSYSQARTPALFASEDNYLRNLRILQTGLRATASGLINPSLLTNVSRILSQHGLATDELGKALAGGAITIPTLESMNAAPDVARQITDLQTAVSQAKAGAGKSPSGIASVASGALQGFVAGGPYGALAGAAAGAITGRSSQKATNKMRNVLNDAARYASPENFQANLDKAATAAREQTMVTGQQAELTEQAAASRAGLTGTGIGTQAQIASAVAPQVAALRSAVSEAGTTSANEVGALASTPVRAPNKRLEDLVGLAAGIGSQVLAARRKKQAAADAFGNTPITGGSSYTDTLGSNIYQPTAADVSSNG